MDISFGGVLNINEIHFLNVMYTFFFVISRLLRCLEKWFYAFFNFGPNEAKIQRKRPLFHNQF